MPHHVRLLDVEVMKKCEAMRCLIDDLNVTLCPARPRVPDAVITDDAVLLC